MASRLKILIVEDVSADAELALRELKKAGIDHTAVRVDTKREFLDRLEEFAPDIILSDYTMPEFDGLAALDLAREKCPDTPFIFISGTIGEEVAIESLKRGAVDYILKTNLKRLAPAVERALQDVAERRARLSAERQLNEARIRFELFMRNLPGEAFIKDAQGRYQFVNWSWEEMRGKKMAEVLGRTDGNLWPELAAQFESTDQLVIDKNDVMRSIETFPRPDGVHHYMVLKFPIRGRDGRPTLVGGIAIDFTDRMQLEAKLQEREAGLHRAQLMAKLAHVITGPDGSFESWSESLPQLIGLDAARMPSSIHEWLDILHPEDRDRVRAAAINAGVTGAQMEIEYRLRRKDGTWADVRQTIEPLTKERNAGDRIRWFNTFQDVTEQKRAQEKIARLNRIHAVLSGINSLIVRVRDRQDLFNGACRIAFEHGNFGMAWIGTLDPATQDVTPVAWAGEGAQEVTTVKSSARDDTPRGKGAVGQAIRERRPVFNNDVAAHGFGGPRMKEILRLGFQSQITLPLFEDQTVVGTLTMYAREPNFFDEEELRLLTELAGDISFALDHIAKEEKIARLSRIQTVMSNINALIVRVRDRQELFDAACRIAVEHGHFLMTWIGLVDRDTGVVRPVATAGDVQDYLDSASMMGVFENKPDGHGLSGRVVRAMKPMVSNDVKNDPQLVTQKELDKRGINSLAICPLIVAGEAVGVLALYAPEVGAFDDEEMRLLLDLAGDIAFALEHLAKEAKIVRLSRIQAVMSSINALIVRVHDRQELFDSACRIAVENGGFGMAWIGLFDAATLDVTPIACAGLEVERFLGKGKTNARADLPQGRGVVGRAIRERRTVFTNDITQESGVGGDRRKEAIRRGYRSLAALPLLVDDTVVATMLLFAKEPNFFDDDELKLLDELAGDISFALEHIGKEEKLNYLAYYDALTGLPNRTLLHDRLTHEVLGAKQNGSKVAVVLGDIKRFHLINETLGRNAGDALLREVAQRFSRLWPEPDYVARIAADCFAGVLSNIKEASDVAHLLEKAVADSFRLPVTIDGNEIGVSLTAGIAIFPTDGEDADTLLKNAEAALKKAKAGGEKYLFYHSKMNAAVTETLLLENKLKRAIDKEEFILHYQPKLDLAKGHINGLEALIRWNDPESGLVPPASFIPLLEETGMILDVGVWAIRKALADYHEWHIQGLQPPRIAVNVSLIQLRQKNFVDVVSKAIKESKTMPHGLDLEITESLIMEDIEGNIIKLGALRDMGINIAIDDFGTGYSSLGYLARLPVNSLKIDRSFIIRMTKDADSMTIVSTIISLAHSLNMKVVAEGVETEEQAQLLRLLKCNEMQGYLFSKPLPVEQLTKMLEGRRAT